MFDDDEEVEFVPKKKRTPPKKRLPKLKNGLLFDSERLEELQDINPDWEKTFGIQYVNKNNPLKVSHKISHSSIIVYFSSKLTRFTAGGILDMKFSADAGLLATAGTVGSIRIYDTEDWKLLTEIRDPKVN
jgi:WD40 repeat protein